MIRANIDLKGLIHLGKMSQGYFFTTLVNNAIPFLVLPILTRFLAPEQFANVALFGFYLALANALTGVALADVISKHFFDSDKSHIARLIGNSLLIALAFSLAALLLIIASYPWLQKYFDLSLFWLILIPITSFAFQVFSIGTTVLCNEKKRRLFGMHQIGNTFINVVISLVLVVFLLLGWQGRAWGIVISYIVSAMIMYGHLKANGYISFVLSKKLIKSILNTVLPLIPNSFQAVILSQVGIFFIQLYFAKELLGVYAVGFQIAFAIKLLTIALVLSWSPYLYEQLANASSVNRMYLTRMFWALIAIMVLGLVFIIIFSGMILRIMASSKYIGARVFIPWFAIGFFFNGLYIFLMPFLIKFEKQRYISIVSFVNMIMMIILNIGLANIFGHMGIAFAFALIYFLMFLAFAWKAQQVFPLPWLKALKVWK